MNIYEAGANLPQNSQRHMAAVDEHHAAPAARDLPRDDQHALAVIDGLLVQQLMQAQRRIIKGKDGLHAQPIATGTDKINGEPRP